MANALTSTPSVSLHSADPGTTGANELSGGSPAYARKTGALGAASSGVRTLTVSAVHDVPSGSTVAYVGLWDGATFLGGFPVTSVGPYGAQGTYQVDSSPITESN